MASPSKPSVIAMNENFIELRDVLSSLRPSLFEIHQIRDRLNVAAICNAQFLFLLLQGRAGEVAKPNLRCETIPDKQIAFVRLSTFLKTPFENFFVRSALQNALGQIAMMYS